MFFNEEDYGEDFLLMKRIPDNNLFQKIGFVVCRRIIPLIKAGSRAEFLPTKKIIEKKSF